MLRFLFALPVALFVTAGLYYWYSSFLKSECKNCYYDSKIICDGPIPISPWLERVIVICGGWFFQPEETDPSNSYTRRDKASPAAPEPVECGEECYPSRIEIVEDALRLTPTALSVADNLAPPYPKACRAKATSGAVTVEYDITPEGAATNARIVSSPDNCFNKVVLRAVSKYRYSPATDASGRAAWRRGIRQTFIFKLEA